MFNFLLFISFLIYSINNLELSSSLYPYSYVLLNQNITLVTHNSIYFISSTMELDISKNLTLKKPITSIDEYEKTAISQFPANQGGYILILVNEFIYFFEHEGTHIGSIDLPSDLLKFKYYTLIPYKTDNNFLYYLISYPINKTSFGFIYCKFDLKSINSNDIIRKYDKAEIKNSYSNTVENLFGARCLFMSKSTENDILVCFYEVSTPLEVHIRFFEPNNNFTEIEENFNYCVSNLTDDRGELFFDVVTDKERKIAYIFMIDKDGYYFKINISNNLEFGDEHKCGDIKLSSDYAFKKDHKYHKVYYFRKTNEIILSSQGDYPCQTYIIRFNLNPTFNQTFKGNIEFCSMYGQTNIFSLMIFENQYILARDNTNNNKILFMNITNLGTIESKEEPIINYYLENNESTNKILTTIPIFTTVPTTIFTTIPTTILITVPTSILTTVLTTISTTTPNTIPTTIFTQKLTSNPTTNPTLIPTTILTSIITITPTTRPTTIPTTIPSIIPNTHLSTIPIDTSNIPKTFPFSTHIHITENAELSEMKITSSGLNISPSDLIIYNSETIVTTINTGKIIDTNNIDSTNIDYISINPNPVTNEEIIHEEKINKTKEDLMKNLSSIIDDIKIGQIHKKIGEDFTVLIYPTNSTYLTNVTHVNFSKCETILRKYYNISDSTIMTFLQIETENDNTKSLINKVEYQAYDGNKKVLDLSLCNDVDIQVFYAIKNSSLVDLNSAMKFKEKGVDIFNLNDSFFNDICEPYSESGNDLILEDRIKDIYQNYSVCEDGCQYDEIDLENMTISCECKVKDNVSIIFVDVNFEKVEGSSTNFEVVKCYNLVFSLKGKLKNIGFWILGVLVLMHIPLLIYYFSKGINPVREYIIKEMKKYGYIKNDNKRNNNKNKKIKVRKKNENSSVRKINLVNSPPPKNKKKNNNNKNDNNKLCVIKNLKIINNNSSVNFLKSKKKDIIQQMNIENKSKTKNKNKKKKVNDIIQNKKENRNKIIKLKNLNKTEKPSKAKIQNKKQINKSKKKLKNISLLPTLGDKGLSLENEKKANLNNFNLISINLNLNKKYIPPESNIILNNYTFEEAVKYDKRQLCEIFYIFALAKQIYFHTFLFILL